jgi:hypothetical protein
MHGRPRRAEGRKGEHRGLFQIDQIDQIKEAQMRFLTKQMSWWRIVLVIGLAAIAIPIASRVSSTAKAVIKERQDYLNLQNAPDNEDAGHKHSKAKHSKESKAAIGLSVAPLQDILYDRRSQYWDQRVLRRLESQDEYLDEQTVDDNEDADAKTSKDSKSAKNKDSKAAADDEDYADDDNVDKELERRREYWRKRLDRDW